jgi:hypothetical protein
MIRSRKLMTSAVLFTATILSAQTQPSFIYVESFRKGSTRVAEETFEVDLDLQNPTCEIRIKDQNDRDRYLFGCTPQRVGSGDDRIIAWQVKLADKQHKIYGNVLMGSPDPTQDRTQIGWLDPGKFAKISLTTERVVKVDNFYCVFQVTDSHFVVPGQPYLDHMTVEVRVTNTMPHSAVRAQKGDKAPS